MRCGSGRYQRPDGYSAFQRSRPFQLIPMHSAQGVQDDFDGDKLQVLAGNLAGRAAGRADRIARDEEF
jgi:hypothetical protein